MALPNSPDTSPRAIQRTYLALTLLNTLATSFIWGINTLFLLDAGLSNAEAFLANAFFTVGQVIFEIPTGIVADLQGRRTSYLYGTIILALSTAGYLGAWMLHAPLWAFAIASILLGLGFTFFSGATEAWLVDALHHSGYQGEIDDVFAKGQSVAGAAMLAGSVAGGFIAQISNLGTPYYLRAFFLLANFAVAFYFMHDWGFAPQKSVDLLGDIRKLFGTSIDLGLKRPKVRWVMLAAPFASGVGIYAFYAMQPYLLQLYGDESAYGVAGLAAAIVAGAQVLGGLVAPRVRRLFAHRTGAMISAAALSAALLVLIGVAGSFWVAIGVLCAWALVFAAIMPIRQAYLNKQIPSSQRATVLSFDALMGSSGGVVFQPLLGRVADLTSYAQSFVVSGAIYGVAIPLLGLAHRENLKNGEAEEETD